MQNPHSLWETTHENRKEESTLSYPQSAEANQSQGRGGFKFELFIRAVEAPPAPPEEPVEEFSWQRIAAIAVAASVGPVALAALAVMVKEFIQTH